jgi:hypothetical protein
MTTPPLTFLAGSMLVPKTIPESWVKVLEYIIPSTTGVLNQQFQAVLTQLNTILALPPQPNLEAGWIVIPINMVNNLQGAFQTYDYQNGAPLVWPPYRLAEASVSNVYNQYSINYYNSPPVPYFVFTP